MSTSFREPEKVSEAIPEPPKDDTAISVEDLKPLEDERDLLKAIGVEDDIRVLPSEDLQDLFEIQSYLRSYMQGKGLPQTYRGVQRAIEGVKKDIGFDEEADPRSVIQKVGSIARSWKELSFISDFEERRQILMKLASARNQQEMDRLILEEMGRRKVWQ